MSYDNQKFAKIVMQYLTINEGIPISNEKIMEVLGNGNPNYFISDGYMSVIISNARKLIPSGVIEWHSPTHGYVYKTES